jgi:hypothetical protein
MNTKNKKVLKIIFLVITIFIIFGFLFIFFNGQVIQNNDTNVPFNSIDSGQNGKLQQLNTILKETFIELGVIRNNEFSEQRNSFTTCELNYRLPTEESLQVSTGKTVNPNISYDQEVKIYTSSNDLVGSVDTMNYIYCRSSKYTNFSSFFENALQENRQLSSVELMKNQQISDNTGIAVYKMPGCDERPDLYENKICTDGRYYIFLKSSKQEFLFVINSSQLASLENQMLSLIETK